jgi:hypothetical protein
MALTKKSDEDKVDRPPFSDHHGGYIGPEAVCFFLDSIHRLSLRVFFLVH